VEGESGQGKTLKKSKQYNVESRYEKEKGSEKRNESGQSGRQRKSGVTDRPSKFAST
jgi:hypothetical protein